MKSKVSLSGVWTLSKTGSLVFCENCKKILGSINKQGYNYLKISLICTCDTCGNIEISRTGKQSFISGFVHRMPGLKNGVAVCKDCGREIFGIIEERVENYSFYAECVCGAKYDTRPNFPRRLGETLQLFKDKENEKSTE